MKRLGLIIFFLVVIWAVCQNPRASDSEKETMIIWIVVLAAGNILVYTFAGKKRDSQAEGKPAKKK